MAATAVPSSGTPFSDWVNPTQQTVVLDLCKSAQAKPRSDERIRFEIPPVGTRMGTEEARRGGHVLDRNGQLVCTRIPSEFDEAIRVIRGGVVARGRAPQLQLLNGPNPPLHKSLDPNAELQEKAETAMQDAATAARLADAQYQLAEHKRRDAAAAAAPAVPSSAAASSNLPDEGAGGLPDEGPTSSGSGRSKGGSGKA